MHRWPDAAEVLAAAERWARRLADRVAGVLAVGCFGSYARGDAGVGSDLDLVVIIEDGAESPNPAADVWAVEDLPVPAERLIYTRSQWVRLRNADTRFYRTLRDEARWLVGSPPPPSPH